MNKSEKTTKLLDVLQLTIVAVVIIYAFTFTTFHVHQAGLGAKFLNFKMPFINGIFLYIILAVGIVVSLLKQFTSKQYYQFTLLDGLFIIYILYNVFSLYWVKDLGLGLAAATTSISFYVLYFILNEIFRQNKTSAVQWIGYLVYALTVAFIIHYFITNVEVLMKFVYTDSSFQKIITQSKSWVGGKNQTACFLALLLPVIVFFQYPKWLTIGLVALLSTHILILGSRNAYIAFILFFSIYVFFNNIKKKQLVALALVSIVILLIFWLFVGFEIFINQLKNNTWDSRFVFWQQTLQMAYDNWLLGIGAGQWDAYRLQYDVWYTYKHPHNDFIRSFAELGLIGVLIFYSIFATVLIAAFKNWKQQKSLAIGAICIVIVYFSLSFFDELKMKDNYSILLALAFALMNSKLTSFRWQTINVKPVYIAFVLILCVNANFLIVHPIQLQNEMQYYKNYRTHLKQKENELAINELKSINQNVVESIDRNPIQVLIANSYFNMRNLDSAKVYYTKVADSHPNYINELSGSMQMNMVRSRKARVWHQYARIHFLDPCNTILKDEALEMPDYKKSSYYQNIINEQRANCKQSTP